MIPRNPINVQSAKAAFDRFIAKVDDSPNPSKGCWEWQAGTFGDGYGRFSLDSKRYQAHRIAWALTFGRDPHYSLVLHECDNPPCVNPLHLVLGDQRTNMDHARQRRGPDVFSTLGEDHPNAKLTERAVREIRYLYSTSSLSQSDLANQYGVSRSLISMVVNREQWSHV